MRNLLFIALFGALGTVSRYTVSGWAYRLFGERLPFGTLAVNVLGSFLLGFAMHVGLNSTLMPRALRQALTVGFLGAFTTFSTFSYETMTYLDEAAWWPALMNTGLNLGLGGVAVWAGMATGRLLLGGS